MSVTIEVNASGEEELIGFNARGQKHVVLASRFMMNFVSGHCFLASSIQGPLQRLNELETEMLEHWLRERGAEIGPNVFDGEPSRD